jgi:hypothetical protein
MSFALRAAGGGRDNSGHILQRWLSQHAARSRSGPELLAPGRRISFSSRPPRVLPSPRCPFCRRPLTALSFRLEHAPPELRPYHEVWDVEAKSVRGSKIEEGEVARKG